MKVEILSVSELPAHTTNIKIFKVLNGFIEARGLLLQENVAMPKQL
jgi:hypothetical protein